MRIDWFVPYLRKAKKGVILRPPAAISRLARRVLPGILFADLVTGKPGLLRRGLKKIGPSWLSSPVRRVCQGICFTAFLILFFYVCWPYTAQPAKTWTGWTPAEIDSTTGRTLALAEQSPQDPLQPGTILHVVDAGAGEEATGKLGQFRVIAAAGQEVRLEPVATPTPDELERLAISVGPWSLHSADPGSWPSHYADDLATKDKIAAEIFLILDPLVSLSTGIASRWWVWSLVWAGVILAVCIFIPRGFCGYLCPLGTLIDLFDWAVGKRVTRFRVSDDGWWVHVKYYLLLGILVAALCGVLVSGFFAAIPVITRGMLFIFGPLQTGSLRGWHLMPPLHAGHYLSIAMFLGVLGLGFFKPRFWCKYVCPSGAVFSLGNLFRVSERKVESSCINCNKCVEICPFDAIKPDFTTRTTDCTLCQTCGGVCPVHAIKFVDRWDFVELKVTNDPPTHETPLGRRGFLAAGVGLAVGTVGGLGSGLAAKAWGADLDNPNSYRPIRPPGSVPEQEFLQMCIRCGECFKACPNDVLQAEGFEQGLEGLWTPRVAADWAGCESSCNACTQVCPTGAIRAIPLAEKKVCRIGLAIVNPTTCLPLAGREACQLCVDECQHAGYNAIEFTRVGTEMTAAGEPIEGTGFLAPVVLTDKCVGCGLCQTRCYGINVLDKHLLTESAIIIEAGPGKEDRLMTGSYLALRAEEQQQRAAEQKKKGTPAASDYLPEGLK
jgi:NAD-dependent dihydropyrimidine dehydrogenase PreA subunit